MKKTARALFVFSLIFCLLPLSLSAQEALKSIEEEYYDFLSLNGVVERPTLGYRTLSDSVWNFKEVESFEENEDGTFTKVRVDGVDSDANVWKNNNLGTRYTLWQAATPVDNWFMRGINQGLVARVYGPEWFNSYNTAAPYGQNDGALWQGRGYNTALTAGVRLEGYGFELTFKPQVSWMQNREFELFDNSAYYTNKYAYIWGYGNNVGADAPQRFGDSSFWTYDWGDSEIRWTWKTFTLGFGTQSPWTGPAWINPIIHSNNAATYPKFDIGLRKTQINLPICNLYIGDIEGRLWTGYLSESKYFDDDDSNNHNLFHGLSISYSPSFLPGLTLSANRACLVKYSLSNLKFIIPIAKNTNVDGSEPGAGEDQKMSLSANWLFPKVGLEIYGELGLDDYGSLEVYIERTMIYTVGVKKTMPISKKYNLKGELFFEWNNTEMSQDFQWQWPYSFGFHHQITQGYTNKGQWLGSGIGYGGNSQFIGFRLFHQYGDSCICLQHANPDINYIYSKTILSTADWENNNIYWRPKSIWNIGGYSSLFIHNNLYCKVNFTYNRIVRFLYEQSSSYSTDNFSISATMKYCF